MRDLEIRGAGSILGTAQSGHIMAVGFDLYCQLLKQAVAQLKGERTKARVEVEVRLDFVATNEAEFVQLGPEARVPAFIPTSFVADATLRIQAYRHLAEITRANSSTVCAKIGGTATANSLPRLTTCSFSPKSSSPRPGPASLESRCANEN